MHKVDAPNNNNGAFRDKDAAQGIAGTLLQADWHNAVQTELVNVVEGAGLTLDKADNTQLKDALFPGLAKAWLQINLTTNAIGASHNVSSVTDDAVGKFIVNFARPFASANYALCGTAKAATAAWPLVLIDPADTPAAGSCLVTVKNVVNDANLDSSRVMVAFFGEQ